MEKKICLSNGEWKLMNCLWERSPRTITAIVEALKDETGWNKHTVIPMLSRLEIKGVVHFVHGARAKQYYPSVPREDAVITETRSFLSKVYSGSVGLMLSAMIDQEELSKEELDELYSILDRAENKEV
ncbi:MAG: BlaI/MecI/CopY family transcriptional regulator [Oscillospiraceae bacterium]|nr:BlaI/MecI/CopY family transcriptional regulator [Oscillospiraceae bacterium]